MEFHIENSSAVIDQTTLSTGVLRMKSLAGFAPGGWPAREAVRFSPSGGAALQQQGSRGHPKSDSEHQREAHSWSHLGQRTLG